MIKIISGTYGLKVGGRVVPKNSKSAPFEIDPAEERRLIDLGIAEEVKVVKPTPAQATTPEPEDEEQSINLEDMTVQNLKKYAAELNIELPKKAKKADIISAIKSAEIENDTADSEAAEGNDMPNLQAQMPE